MTREEAIKRLKEYSQYAYGIYHNEQKDEEAFDMAIEALSADEADWIPCSERLPEDDTNVLVSYRYRYREGDQVDVKIDITSYGYVYFGGHPVMTNGEPCKHWRNPFEYFASNYEVIAWMPLPEPYKGGEDE